MIIKKYNIGDEVEAYVSNQKIISTIESIDYDGYYKLIDIDNMWFHPNNLEYSTKHKLERLLNEL